MGISAQYTFYYGFNRIFINLSSGFLVFGKRMAILKITIGSLTLANFMPNLPKLKFIEFFTGLY
jgi:hypothetical protein